MLQLNNAGHVGGFSGLLVPRFSPPNGWDNTGGVPLRIGEKLREPAAGFPPRAAGNPK
ncbi:MAG: hypothetical protein ACREDY_26620 [Bradyrhizobium sp.]